MQRIVHTNNKSIKLKEKYMQPIDECFKPVGMWWSADGEWEQWCEDNMPHWVKKYNYSVELDMNNIYVIYDMNSLRMLTYAFPKYMVGTDGKKYIYGIDWPAVAKKYKGVEIINYWETRPRAWGDGELRHTWFSGLDCNSGCVWDLTAVKSWKPAIIHIAT